MNQKYNSIFLSIVIFILAITILPYFFTFNSYKLSSSPSDWGSFGDYVSGVLSVINLLIFIFLTFYISNLDKKKSENELRLQKKIVITQFRQSELDLVYKALNEALDNNGTEDKPIVLNKIMKASIILTDFINQKSYLFPILNEDIIKQKALNLIEKLSQFFNIFDETYGLELDKNFQKKFEIKLQAYMFMKNDFIESLQLFILKDLD